MDAITPAGTAQQPTVLPLVVRPRPGLARISGALALSVAQRAVLALVRREPAAWLALGFGAGLFARAPLAGRAITLLARGRREAQPTSPISEVVAIATESVTVRTTYLLRRR
jgi:hypothetical protein